MVRAIEGLTATVATAGTPRQVGDVSGREAASRLDDDHDPPAEALPATRSSTARSRALQARPSAPAAQLDRGRRRRRRGPARSAPRASRQPQLSQSVVGGEAEMCDDDGRLAGDELRVEVAGRSEAVEVRSDGARALSEPAR